MDEPIKSKKSEFHILKKRIDHIKNKRNDIKNKNVLLSSKRNKKFLSVKRPYSNYIKNNNKILSQDSINNKLCCSQIRKSNKKLMSNKLISTEDLEDNSLSNINSAQKYFNNNEKNIGMNKSQSEFQKCFYKKNNVPKSAKYNIKVYKNFLFDRTVFNKVNKSINSSRISQIKKGYLSNRNLIHKNKYLELIKELFSGKKNNNKIIEPNSSSTTINSNINNSYSSHFLFGLSSFNSNIYPNVLQNSVIFENQKNNKLRKNKKDTIENSKLMTSIEKDLNKLLILKKENSNKNKNIQKKESKKLDSYYLYKNYDKILNLKEKAINISLKRNKIIKEENISGNHSIDIIKSINSNNIPTNIKKNNNKYMRNIKNNKASNLIVKYAFLNYEINKIKRKVDFLNPKNGDHINLDTANIYYNNFNYKNEDFKTYGYEMNPEKLYYLNQKRIKKNRTIRIQEEKKENKYIKERDNKKIFPKYYLLNKSNNMKYKKNNYQKYRTIDIKNLNKINKNELDENYKNTESETQRFLNIYSFDLGESLHKNKLDFNSIKREDIEEGKKLWARLTKTKKSTVNIYNSKQNKKIKEESSNTLRVKSSRISEMNKARAKNNIQNKILDKNNSYNEFIRKKINRNLSQRIDPLKIHQFFRKEKGFNEIKKLNHNIYDIDFRITDEDEKEKESQKENEKLEESKKDKVIEPYIKNEKENIQKKRNSVVYIDQYVNKLYKVKNNSKENLNKTNNNNQNIKINNKNKSSNYRIYKSNKYKKDKKIKGKYNENLKSFNNKTEKVSKELKKEDKKENYFSENKSMEIEQNPILELYTSLDSEDEKYNLSENNYIYNNKLKIDNIFKRQNRKKSTLKFDKYLKNFKLNYKEDENMDKYFDEIFNKYGIEENDENDEQLVDIKFFGYDFKIKRKNQINFSNNLMSNIRKQEKIKKNNDNKIVNLILERFLKNRKSIKNKDVFSSRILFRRKKRNSKNINNINLKSKIKSKNNEISLSKKEKEEEKKEEIKEEREEEEFKSQYFIGINKDSIKELEKKKEEILRAIKNNVNLKILKGEIGYSDMDNFLKFEKRMNAYNINQIDNKKLIKLFEQEFISFNEELEIITQKRKEERRINNFIDDMKFDIDNNNYIRNIQKKLFCNVFDFNEKYNINILNPKNDFFDKM